MVLENTKKIDSLRLSHQKELEEAAETHAKEVARLKGAHLQELEEVTSESAKVQRKLKDKFIAEKAVLKSEKEQLKDKLASYEDNLATGADTKSEFIKVRILYTRIHSCMLISSSTTNRFLQKQSSSNCRSLLHFTFNLDNCFILSYCHILSFDI